MTPCVYEKGAPTLHWHIRWGQSFTVKPIFDKARMEEIIAVHKRSCRCGEVVAVPCNDLMCVVRALE
jgi:hypothetical protein